MKKLSATEKHEARERDAKVLLVLERARRELPGFQPSTHLSDFMDLESLNHAEDICVDWDKLLQAPAFDFSHDMYGIRRHMTRATWPGTLGGFFLPRCARSGKLTAR